MDSELFELCKEVYERTGWHTVRGYITQEGYGDSAYWYDDEIAKDGYYPLYTSDYLLEKLPVVTLSSGYGRSWSATDRKIDNSIVVISSTPLKALLKLTISLHEAGELTDLVRSKGERDE